MVSISETVVTVQSVDQPQAETIWVAYARVHHCPVPIADTFWPTKSGSKNIVVAPMGGHDCHSVNKSSTRSTSDIWRGHLRRGQSQEDALPKSGDV